MKKIVVIRVTGGNDCYECGGCADLQTICDFEEVSDEDFRTIANFVNRQKYDSNPRYLIIEQFTVQEVKEDLRDFIKKSKEDEKVYNDLIKKKEEGQRKREETLRLKREEKEKKKFEELKKKFEESDKDQ